MDGRFIFTFAGPTLHGVSGNARPFSSTMRGGAVLFGAAVPARVGIHIRTGVPSVEHAQRNRVDPSGRYAARFGAASSADGCQVVRDGYQRFHAEWPGGNRRLPCMRSRGGAGLYKGMDCIRSAGRRGRVDARINRRSRVAGGQPNRNVVVHLK